MVFQKGHLPYLGTKKTRFKKGHVPWNKGTKGLQEAWNKGKVGMFSKETRKKMSEVNTTHGKSKTRIFKCWRGMKSRCNNPNSSGYPLYGKRGIEVCKRWHKFENFYEDMKKGYSDDLTLDRVDNNGNYKKSNCRWATAVQQANNKRNSRLFEYKGIVDTITNWANYFGVKRYLLADRIYKRKWAFEKALFTPVRGGVSYR